MQARKSRLSSRDLGENPYGTILIDFSTMQGDVRARDDSFPDKISQASRIVQESLKGGINTREIRL